MTNCQKSISLFKFSKITHPNSLPVLFVYWEAMIIFDGRLGWKQYMPKKPIKWGIKIWCLFDSLTGYCLAFSMKNENEEKGLALVVMDLMRGYLIPNYYVYAGNSFNSIPLVRDFLLKKTYCCHTIRPNMKGLCGGFKTKPFPKSHNSWSRKAFKLKLLHELCDDFSGVSVQTCSVHLLAVKNLKDGHSLVCFQGHERRSQLHQRGVVC